MKIKSKIKISMLIILVSAIFFIHANAAVDPELQIRSADSLVKLQIMHGDGTGDLKLNDTLTRSQFISLVIEMMGYAKSTDISNTNIEFTDISRSHWAYDKIKIAVKMGLFSGYADNTIHPDNSITLAEADTVLLIALGYRNTLTGAWPQNVLNKASQLKLNENIPLNGDEALTRGDASVLIYNALTVNFYK